MRLSSKKLRAPRGEETGEDEGGVCSPYLLHLFRPNSHAAHQKNFLVGLERPTTHFGHGTVCKSGVAPAQLGAIPRPFSAFCHAQLPIFWALA